MRTIKVSDDANADIERIFLDGTERFGLLQAEKLFNDINASFQHLSHHPEIGRDISYLLEGALV